MMQDLSKHFIHEIVADSNISFADLSQEGRDVNVKLMMMQVI